MARLQHPHAHTTRRATAGLLSAVLHVGLAVLIVLSGGPGDGAADDPAVAMQWTWLEAPVTERLEDVGRSQTRPAMPESIPGEPLGRMRIEPPTVPPPRVDIPDIDSGVSRLAELDIQAASDVAPEEETLGPESTLSISKVEASAIAQHVERLAAELATTPRTRVAWQQEGRHYEAELVLVPARDGVEPERAIAEITTEERGRQLRTWISLKRLPFSHYAKLIDRWDPMVQLHDDEIVGRMHVNSRFNVLYDSQAAPRVLGKVTTAAGGFNLEARGRRRDADVFLEGIETSAGRIPFSGDGWSFEGAGHPVNARRHDLADHTRIRFFADGGYAWREGDAGEWQYAAPAGGQAVYFMASGSAAVYVQGIVSGQFLVYSPRRIVVQGNLTYARDPRSDPDSGDSLGLVSGRDIEVAAPEVTGPGDLHIHAALFARRRIVVADADRGSTATLNIFGSLAAGTLSESEPRYATRVEHDRRFDRRRPPGFPSTNRFATEDWDRQWTQVAERPVSGGS